MDLEVTLSVYQNGKRAPQYELQGSDFDGHLTLQEFLELTKQTLIITADTVLREEQDNGFDKTPVVVVDGRVGKPVINVSPLGQIDFIARADMNDIIRETYLGISDRSPVRSGRFKSSNYVFLNSTQVASDISSLNSWLESSPDFKEKDLIRFVNIQPYARKLERWGVRSDNAGGTQGRKRYTTRKNRPAVKILVPNGSYYITARSIRNKYKRNSIIRFEFIQGSQIQITERGETAALKGSFKPKKKGKPGRPYLYPSIVISVQESGTV